MKTRGALVGLVYSKTMRSRSNKNDRGKVITLMNTDIDSLNNIANLAQDVWAYSFQLIVGMAILAFQIRWLSPLPLLVIFLCSRVSKFVAQNISGRQKAWNDSTQERLSAINGVLGSIKQVKMLGVSAAAMNYLDSLRSAEIESAKNVRRMMVTYNASANANGIFTPALTMMLYGAYCAARHSRLDTETAFTTVAVLSLVISPANMIMTIIPRMFACMASFERLQTYLLEPARQDQREIISDKADQQLMLDTFAPEISLKNVTVPSEKGSGAALSEVTLDIARSSIVICAGNTGAGKTVLAKVLLGEVGISDGSIQVRSTHIGYCDQTPWLPNGSIQEVMSCLTHDLGQLPREDQTEIGSGALKLSGGQRQRLALARMLYDDCHVAILDDPFSSLDGNTESQVIENLFSDKGIFRQRKTTVVWATNASQYFDRADKIILLEKSRVIESGSWLELNRTPDMVSKIISDTTIPHEPAQTLQQQREGSRMKAKKLDAQMDLTRKNGKFISICAPLAFFSTADIGSLLNRFSQDIQLVDRDLPGAFMALSNQTFKLLVQISLLLVVQKILIFILFVILILVYGIARLYLRTSRQVRLEELASRSAVMSQIVETVDGMVTIRAFGWQGNCQTNFDRIFDLSQGPYYLSACLELWLSLILNSVVSATAVIIIAYAVIFRGTTSDASLGVALNVIFVTSGTIIRFVDSWADWEISLGAIERLKTLNDEIEKEDLPGEDQLPGSSWPTKGNIVVEHCTAAYNKDGAALHDVSLAISAGQRVVICGRTGSGNSSLILSFLRLIESTGKISVDGVDLSRIARQSTRGQCFITVPQDVMLLPDASLRFNLDPSGEADSTEIVSALEKVGLWTYVCLSGDSEDCEVLDQKVSELPILSAGQTQMIGLARAVIKKTILEATCKPVLLLDEVTSTESAIYDLVQNEFTIQGYTVVIVAHRLNTISGRMRLTDIVITMDDGKVQSVRCFKDVEHVKEVENGEDDKDIGTQITSD
ncbi:hypothetical protein MY10362_001057 [Beauveria mimosiformis]